jgi:hypothetical protein
MDWTWALIVLFVAFLNEAFLCRTVTVSLTPTPITGLHVVGNEIRNKDGKRVIFHGVNRSGLEFSCVHNVGIFDGPSDASSVKVIASWKTNIIRLPLNEDCWLGINGINPQYSGQNYQRAVHNYVKGLNDAGLAVILDLHWTAPGSQQADGQRPMPDQDHSIAFWSSVAEQFKNNSAVLFDLFNEPFPGSWHSSFNFIGAILFKHCCIFLFGYRQRRMEHRRGLDMLEGWRNMPWHQLQSCGNAKSCQCCSTNWGTEHNDVGWSSVGQFFDAMAKI